LRAAARRSSAANNTHTGEILHPGMIGPSALSTARLRVMLLT
jgi:hypothetical protein